MKLYTEEQIKEAMFLYRAPIRPLVQQVLEQLTPIELPSDSIIKAIDEEIKRKEDKLAETIMNGIFKELTNDTRTNDTRRND